MSFSRIGVVTGANKGIGLATVLHLALQYPSCQFNTGPLLIYLTARSQQRGEAALRALHADPQLKKAKALSSDGGLTTLKYHDLDISEPGSVADFAAFLKREHPAGIDTVVNNAGIAMEGFNTDVVETTLKCNYYGTLSATRTLLPLIRPNGRLVNVSSMVGQLSDKYSASIRSAFASSKTVEDVTKLMEDFTAAVREGKEKEVGWPSAAYAVSKSGVTGMTRAVARGHREEGGEVLVNSCCPGYVSTDMTKHRGAKTVDEGARTPVLLALGDIGGRSGEFWQNEKVIAW